MYSLISHKLGGMHDDNGHFLSRDGAYYRVCLRSCTETSIDVPNNTVIAGVLPYHGASLALCSIGGLASLAIIHNDGRFTFVWSGVMHPTIHGFTLGSQNTVWVSHGESRIVGICNWKVEETVYCPAPGALSTTVNGQLVAACGEAGFRDSVCFFTPQVAQIVRYDSLNDVYCLKCLSDGTVVVSDYNGINGNSIKLLNRSAVLRVLVESIRPRYTFSGVCVNVDGAGIMTASNIKYPQRGGLFQLSTRLSAGVQSVFPFRASQSFLRTCPHLKEIIVCVFACLSASRPLYIPRELILHIFSLMF